MFVSRFSRAFSTSGRLLASKEKGVLEQAGETVKKAGQAFKVCPIAYLMSASPLHL